MKDLTEISGLPIAVDEEGRLHFSGGLPEVTPAVRRLQDMREVMADPTAGGQDELYFMYRDVGFPEERNRLHDSGLRYDITVIRPGTVGAEFIKTAGHYHPIVPGAAVTFPEVYEVLSGVAHYLLQKVDETGLVAEDVVLVEARPGDKVIVPPNYGHITINPGNEPLVMTNLVEKDFKSVYDPIVKSRGGAYYEILEDGEPIFAENETYREVAELRIVPARPNPEAGLEKGKPLYRAGVEDPKKFQYLVRPQEFLAVMKLD